MHFFNNESGCNNSKMKVYILCFHTRLTYQKLVKIWPSYSLLNRVDESTQIIPSTIISFILWFQLYFLFYKLIFEFRWPFVCFKIVQFEKSNKNWKLQKIEFCTNAVNISLMRNSHKLGKPCLILEMLDFLESYRCRLTIWVKITIGLFI